MFTTLPTDAHTALDWSWVELEPYYADLAARPLDAATAPDWLADWSRLARLVGEVHARLSVARTRDTTDAEAEARYLRFVESIRPAVAAADQALKQKLLASGLEPSGLDLPLRKLRTQADLFREANLPLMAQTSKLGTQYDKLMGAQTVTWEGETVSLTRLQKVLQEGDRSRREQAWRLARARQLEDRAGLNDLWRKLLALRGRIAANAGLESYRDFAWRANLRFDYSPADCARFHDAIAEVVVPAASRVYARHRARLGQATLRPWDLTDGLFARPADPPGTAPLSPFADGQTLLDRGETMLARVDPQFGAYFGTMRREDLLDVENRPGKAPGGYCTSYATARRPFIFMNAVGLHRDVQTLLHEAGHAFHDFEMADLPYHIQAATPMEFNEVASMAMELLAAPYLAESEGGFYSPPDAARARIEHLEDTLLFWPYMAVVDAFQHWVYTHAGEAADPARCDATWRELFARFIPAIDWSGLEAELETGWQRKLHIFQAPFYYIEYGLASLGAVQVWAGSLGDPAGAVVRYRRALALGGTVSLPELFTTAGARFALDAEALGEAVALIETTVAALEPVAGVA